MSFIDASTTAAAGLAPGRTTHGQVDVIQMPPCTLIEILNDGRDELWFAVNPPGDTFTAGAIGSQVVDVGEYIEWPVTGSPRVCVRGPGVQTYQVRRIA